MSIQTIYLIFIQFSSIFGRATYIGYFIDWLLDSIFVAANLVILTLSTSMYIGIFLYINAMVKDMKMRFSSIDDSLSIEPNRTKIPPSDRIWLIYEQEIEFHIEIIGYFHISPKELKSIIVECY